MAMDIVFPSNFIEYEGDLLKANTNVIAHQTNCTSTHVAGLAASIFYKHHNANGNLTNPNFSRYGTVELIHVTNSSYRYIANIYGQVGPGLPTTGPDTSVMRLVAFEQALHQLISMMYDKGLVSAAFPKLIGCNLAGGNWSRYRQMLRDFAVEASDIYFHVIEKKF